MSARPFGAQLPPARAAGVCRRRRGGAGGGGTSLWGLARCPCCVLLVLPPAFFPFPVLQPCPPLSCGRRCRPSLLSEDGTFTRAAVERELRFVNITVSDTHENGNHLMRKLWELMMVVVSTRLQLREKSLPPAAPPAHVQTKPFPFPFAPPQLATLKERTLVFQRFYQAWVECDFRSVAELAPASAVSAPRLRIPKAFLDPAMHRHMYGSPQEVAAEQQRTSEFLTRTTRSRSSRRPLGSCSRRKFRTRRRRSRTWRLTFCKRCSPRPCRPRPCTSTSRLRIQSTTFSWPPSSCTRRGWWRGAWSASRCWRARCGGAGWGGLGLLRRGTHARTQTQSPRVSRCIAQVDALRDEATALAAEAKANPDLADILT